MEVVETISVNANYLSVFDTILDGTPTVKDNSVNFFDNFHDCKMSSGAVKTIKKAANVICYLSRKKHFAEVRTKVGCTSYRNKDVLKKAIKTAKNSHLCTFVTLTLPATQQHSDKELTNYILNPFLVYARKYFNVRYYIWKKELQENGNLHFHLIVDRFIDYNCLRREWNKLCNRGFVDGVDKPFDYVDRYTQKWREFYKNGFNSSKVIEYVSNLKSVQDEIEQKAIEFENKNSRFIENAEYENIKSSIILKELEKYKAIYVKEMQLPESERFINPNSTDIQAVKSPALVSFYLSKYISKNIDVSPELQNYYDKVDYYKSQIFAMLKDIERKKENNEDYTSELEYIEKMKNILKNIREKECPIQGFLWYKSKTLSVFLKGAKDFIYNALFDELCELTKFLIHQEDKRNLDLKKKGKEPIKLIIRTYQKNEDGTDNTEKCICTTLLIDIFTLSCIRDDAGKRRFPRICRMWEQYVNDGINENYKKGLYEK